VSKAPQRKRPHPSRTASRLLQKERLDARTERSEPDPPTHEDDPIITLAEVGRQTGLSRSTISRWVQSGAFEAEKILRKPNGLPAIRQSAINTFLAGTAYPVKKVIAPTEESNNGVQQ
jgi:hypothetical protein